MTFRRAWTDRETDRCQASVSGKCLMVTEGAGRCTEGCEYRPDDKETTR